MKTKLSVFKMMLTMMSNQNGHIGFGPRYPLMEPNKEGGQGGGGGGQGNNQGGGQGAGNDDKLAQAMRQIQSLKSELGRMRGNANKNNQGGGAGAGDDENDLRKKVAREKEDEERKKKDAKSIEDVLRYNLTIENYVKENKDILPDEFENILKMADKESYDSATEKANAIKASFIQAFFSVQSNVELLTSAQKAQLDDYLKMTKNGREESAAQIYLNLFEPTISMAKRLKKAEELELSRSGLLPNSKDGNAYRDKLIELGKKRFKIKE